MKGSKEKLQDAKDLAMAAKSVGFFNATGLDRDELGVVLTAMIGAMLRKKDSEPDRDELEIYLGSYVATLQLGYWLCETLRDEKEAVIADLTEVLREIGAGGYVDTTQAPRVARGALDRLAVAR